MCWVSKEGHKEQLTTSFSLKRHVSAGFKGLDTAAFKGLDTAAFGSKERF